jgi:hypothetical protein
MNRDFRISRMRIDVHLSVGSGDWLNDLTLLCGVDIPKIEVLTQKLYSLNLAMREE